MREFLETLEQRINQLKQVIREKENALTNVPKGTIHISKSDYRTQFYLKDDNTRKYMKESEKPLVRQLCQKDYDQRILDKAQKELKELEKLYNNYPDKACETIYEKLNLVRQQLITPIWLPDDEFVKQWEAVTYTPKGFDPNCPEYYTDKGERVRSKSEILIANALKKHRIPYRFEYPYQLNPYSSVIHPDFTILNVRKRKEYIWEHMGKMDGEGYRDYALNRIIEYEKNGIFPGDKLILTHETLAYPLNSKIIEKTIEHYLN